MKGSVPKGPLVLNARLPPHSRAGLMNSVPFGDSCVTAPRGPVPTTMLDLGRVRFRVAHHRHRCEFRKREQSARNRDKQRGAQRRHSLAPHVSAGNANRKKNGVPSGTAGHLKKGLARWPYPTIPILFPTLPSTSSACCNSSLVCVAVMMV